jgi:phosphoserine phosphatase RsbU/P
MFIDASEGHEMAVLFVLAPPSAGVQLPVNSDGPTIIGRDPECHIVLSKRSLSRHHARISVVEGRFYIEDCQSTNGTFLNGQRLHHPTPLQDGDIINLHDLPLCFSLTDASVVGDDATVDIPPAEEVSSKETEYAVPVYPGSPGASVLKGRLECLISAAQQLGSSLDLADLSQRMLDVLFRMFPQAILAELYLVDESEELKCAAAKRSSAWSGPTLAEGPVDRQRIGEVFASGQGVVYLPGECAGSARGNGSGMSVILAPIFGATHRGLGVVVLATDEMSHRFTPDDLELVSAVAVLTGQAMAFARSHQLLLQLERTQRHLEAARQIQLNMVRHTRPRVPGYLFADYYRPAEKVGGDYYFYESLPDGRAIIGIADASGKGLAAAMTIARFAGEVRFRIATSPTLKKALADLNRFIAETGPTTFVTCCICVLDPCAHTLTVANAGHLPPLRSRVTERQIGTLQTPRGGLPLGIDRDSICHPVTTALAAGDRIVLITDGVTEAMNHACELYGVRRLKRVLQTRPPTLEACVNAIVADVEEFRQDRPASDDMCVVALERAAA